MEEGDSATPGLQRRGSYSQNEILEDSNKQTLGSMGASEEGLLSNPTSHSVDQAFPQFYNYLN